MYKTKKVLKKRLSPRGVSTEHGLPFSKFHPELTNFCWQQLASENIYNKEESGLRFRLAYFLFADFCRYQAIMEKKSSRPCLLNGGLLQKSFLIESDLQQMSHLINNYLPLVPLPNAIIYINTEDKELIVERLINRNKIIPTQLGKNKKELIEDIVQWQYQFEIIISWMLKHNVIVYNIDGARSVKENVLTITKILEKQKYFQLSPNQKENTNVIAEQQALM